eukprot:TRINITY_DN10785_c0_g1_i2.p1 TRINITY_DN10785_c0_g1~~TRINITY_DN10785_c0_g1_i2.p1  ORF type:complete len:1367 (+),score=394.58 TRINITY_DN10785_c0_g1_i2:109-4209(+)
MAAAGREFAVSLDPNIGFGCKVSGGIDSPAEGKKDAGIYLTFVMVGGSAEKAGLKPDDQIISVNNIPMEGLTHEDAFHAIGEALRAPQINLVMYRETALEAAATSTNVAQARSEASEQTRLTTATALPNEPDLVDLKVVATDEIQGASPGGFGCRLTELVELIAERNSDGMERYANFGGPEGLASKLNSSLERGIRGDANDVAARSEVFGLNKTPEVKPRSLLQLMWDAAKDPILIVLAVAAVLSILLGVFAEDNTETGWIEGVAILVSVVIVIMVTAVNDLQKEKQFRDLQNQQAKAQMADVIRNGQQTRINYDELLVGDVVLVNAGLVLPADGVLFRCNNIKCDESALTGESYDINKSLTDNPWLLSGTAVKQGSGAMMVTCVGLFSEEGIIQKLITGVGEEETERLLALDKQGREEVEEIANNIDQRQQQNFDALPPEEQDKLEKQEKKKEKRESVLQAKLERMALQIGKAATFMAVLTVIVLVTAYSIEHFGVDNEDYETGVWSEYLEFVIVGITVLVVAIPEGLPLAVTISLAYSVKKMMKENNLVRVLAACETMGNATTICSDKTGTLTKNRMTVVKSWIAGQTYTGSEEVRKVDPAVCERLMAGIAHNSDRASNYHISAEDGLPIQENNKTECACLKFADDIGDKTYRQYRDEIHVDSYAKVYPFDSAKKRMQTVVKLPSGGYRMYVKGASEIILGMSTCYDAGDKTIPITAADAEVLRNDVINTFAAEALRVICLAYRDFDIAQDWEDEDGLLRQLTVSAFVGIQDPVRDEVPAAVLDCQKAGVVVRMVTGDNMITARAIAINCGIISEGDGYVVMEGPDFRRQVVRPDGSLDYDKLNEIAPKLRVMGRCSPTDKFNLVRGLIKAGEVVAVTGDGTNDGPALSEADVGFSMGIAGTDVARQASDIVITDDNFKSIVRAISWGRNVYDSISKFLVFQLTVNVVAIITAFVGACVLRESPLRAVQLLWVNLIMDTFAALALATEPPTPELLDRPPYGRNKPLLSRIMIRQILGHSIYQLIVLFVLVFEGDDIFDIRSGRRPDLTEQERDDDITTQHYSIVFNTFVWMQIFNELNARVIDGNLACDGPGCSVPGPLGALLRPWRGLFNNWIFVGVLVGTIIVQALIVEFGGKAISTESLSAEQWGACVAFGAGSLIWNVVIHYLFPHRWIPEWFEPGAYTDLSPDRAKEIEEEDQETPPALPPAGLDRTPDVTRRTLPLPERPTSTPTPDEPTIGSLLWGRAARRARQHAQVIGAFRTAGQIARLRQRTAALEPTAIGGPSARAARRASEGGEAMPTPAEAMWRTAVARVQYQQRVVNALQAPIVARRGSALRALDRPNAPLTAATGYRYARTLTLQTLSL